MAKIARARQSERDLAARVCARDTLNENNVGSQSECVGNLSVKNGLDEHETKAPFSTTILEPTDHPEVRPSSTEFSMMTGQTCEHLEPPPPAPIG
jgi:hypothetical protein